MAARAQQVAVVGGLMAFGAAWLVGASSATPTATPPLPPPTHATLLEHWQPRPGDVVFRASGDIIGDAIRARSGSAGRFSHVGVVVTTTGSPMILDVSPFGSGRAGLHTIATFVDEPTSAAVLVMRPRLPFDGAALNRAAAAIVRQRVPFDYQFDAGDDRALYCSELVFKVLRAAGVSWTGVRTRRMTVLPVGERDVITPDALARSPALMRIAT